jgi:hypothetical protein
MIEDAVRAAIDATTDEASEALATHCLGLAGFQTYLPRLRERRIMRGRRIEVRPPLFPGYAFVVTLQWHGARWCPGVLSLIMAGSPTRSSPSCAPASATG